MQMDHSAEGKDQCIRHYSQCLIKDVRERYGNRIHLFKDFSTSSNDVIERRIICFLRSTTREKRFSLERTLLNEKMPCIGNQSTTDATNSSTFAFAPEPVALRIVRTVLFSLTAALALVGNYVVCRAVWKNPGAKPIAHYLVSNLAFAEIISMVCLVFTFQAYEPPWSWELGYVMCKILDPLQVASLLVITTTLAILAVYRCVLLIKPMVTKPTRRQTCCAILVTWVGSVGLSVPAGHFRVVNSYGDNCETHACEEVFPEGFEHYQDVYSVVLFVVNFALPLAIMAISYSLVSEKIRQHIFVIKRLQDEQSKAMSSVTQYSVCPEELQTAQRGSLNSQTDDENEEEIELTNIAGHQKDNKIQRTIRGSLKPENLNLPLNNRTLNMPNKNAMELENDLLKLVFALVLIFVVCYIPYQVQFLMMEFKVDTFAYWPYRYIFSRIVFTLTCLPSALHPVCYGVMSKFYHKAFIRIIACRDYTVQNV